MGESVPVFTDLRAPRKPARCSQGPQPAPDQLGLRPVQHGSRWAEQYTAYERRKAGTTSSAPTTGPSSARRRRTIRSPACLRFFPISAPPSDAGSSSSSPFASWYPAPFSATFRSGRWRRSSTRKRCGGCGFKAGRSSCRSTAGFLPLKPRWNSSPASSGTRRLPPSVDRRIGAGCSTTGLSSARPASVTAPGRKRCSGTPVRPLRGPTPHGATSPPATG